VFDISLFEHEAKKKNIKGKGIKKRILIRFDAKVKKKAQKEKVRKQDRQISFC
jgi:hypothetical protein